jgi:hypothetical protein
MKAQEGQLPYRVQQAARDQECIRRSDQGRCFESEGPEFTLGYLSQVSLVHIAYQWPF